MDIEIAFVSSPLKTHLLACTLPYFPMTLVVAETIGFTMFRSKYNSKKKKKMAR